MLTTNTATLCIAGLDNDGIEHLMAYDFILNLGISDKSHSSCLPMVSASHNIKGQAIESLQDRR